MTPQKEVIFPGEEKSDKSRIFTMGVLTGVVIGVTIVAAFWVLSIPHIDALPDLELNPCIGWGTTDGTEFATPSDKYYDAVCVNRTPMNNDRFTDRNMHIEESCRCYEYKNWWKFVKPSSMFL
jgi:hypothetical protein